MNIYIEQQIMNAINQTKNFEKLCALAAVKDDGTTDKDEEKILKKIEKANEKYRKMLRSIT